MLVLRDEVSQGVVELAVCANLNEETVTEFKDALNAELDRPEHQIHLNLDKVHSINSAALGAIILFQKKAREYGKNITITQCSGELRKTLLAIRLDRIVEMRGEVPPTLAR